MWKATAFGAASAASRSNSTSSALSSTTRTFLGVCRAFADMPHYDTLFRLGNCRPNGHFRPNRISAQICSGMGRFSILRGTNSAKADAHEGEQDGCGAAGNQRNQYPPVLSGISSRFYSLDYEHTIETWFSAEFICATLGGRQVVSMPSHTPLDSISESASVAPVSERMPIRQ